MCGAARGNPAEWLLQCTVKLKQLYCNGACLCCICLPASCGPVHGIGTGTPSGAEIHMHNLVTFLVEIVMACMSLAGGTVAPWESPRVSLQQLPLCTGCLFFGLSPVFLLSCTFHATMFEQHPNKT